MYVYMYTCNWWIFWIILKLFPKNWMKDEGIQISSDISRKPSLPNRCHKINDGEINSGHPQRWTMDTICNLIGGDPWRGSSKMDVPCMSQAFGRSDELSSSVDQTRAWQTLSCTELHRMEDDDVCWVCCHGNNTWKCWLRTNCAWDASDQFWPILSPARLAPVVPNW